MVLICIFLIVSDIEHIFMCLYVFLGKLFIQLLCPFLNMVVWILSLLLSCTSSLYSLDINLFLGILFANIFSPSVGCLFVLLMASFTVQKLFHLMLSRLFIFAFVSLACGDRSKKILLRQTSKSILPMFSSGSFMVSGLTFKYLIHLEFIFVYGVRK